MGEGRGVRGKGNGKGHWVHISDIYFVYLKCKCVCVCVCVFGLDLGASVEWMSEWGAQEWVPAENEWICVSSLGTLPASLSLFLLLFEWTPEINDVTFYKNINQLCMVDEYTQTLIHTLKHTQFTFKQWELSVFKLHEDFPRLSRWSSYHKWLTVLTDSVETLMRYPPSLD